jgi:hypothetical protein
MKFGFRTPSLKKRLAARTSLKRFVRHSIGIKAPKGMGILTNPKKAIYNKIYQKTTIGLDKPIKLIFKPKKKTPPATLLPDTSVQTSITEKGKLSFGASVGVIIGVFFFFGGLFTIPKNFFSGLLILFSGVLLMPPFNDLLKNKYNIHLNTNKRIILVILLFFIGEFLIFAGK